MKVVNLKGYMCDKCGKIYMDKYMAERDIYYCDTNTIILIDWEDFKNVKKN